MKSGLTDEERLAQLEREVEELTALITEGKKNEIMRHCKDLQNDLGNALEKLDEDKVARLLTKKQYEEEIRDILFLDKELELRLKTLPEQPSKEIYQELNAIIEFGKGEIKRLAEEHSAREAKALVDKTNKILEEQFTQMLKLLREEKQLEKELDEMNKQISPNTATKLKTLSPLEKPSKNDAAFFNKKEGSKEKEREKKSSNEKNSEPPRKGKGTQNKNG